MLEAFQDIILPAAKICFSTDEEGLLIFKEKAVQSKIKRLSIQKVPQQSFAFTLDYQPKNNKCFKQLSCYVDPANAKGVNKGCDLVIVTQKNCYWYILLIELKSDKPNIKETELQLQNSELFVRYLVSMLERYYNIDTKNIQYRSAMVTTSKSGIKASTYKPNDSKCALGNLLRIPVQVKNGEASTYLGKFLGG